MKTAKFLSHLVLSLAAVPAMAASSQVPEKTPLGDLAMVLAAATLFVAASYLFSRQSRGFSR